VPLRVRARFSSFCNLVSGDGRDVDDALTRSSCAVSSRSLLLAEQEVHRKTTANMRASPAKVSKELLIRRASGVKQCITQDGETDRIEAAGGQQTLFVGGSGNADNSGA
jgi:hypothetical protein